MTYGKTAFFLDAFEDLETHRQEDLNFLRHQHLCFQTMGCCYAIGLQFPQFGEKFMSPIVDKKAYIILDVALGSVSYEKRMFSWEDRLACSSTVSRGIAK